ncbi:MAG: hypothetical protein F4092_10345 [Rhodospirillaceae bacterium]|nr:hypothetical protein [Rhodospirillaceae bacterium]
MERENIVAVLLKAACCRMVGSVRLQKVVYLLDRLGLDSGFHYDYHHYGPFSRDLDNAVADAEAFGLVEQEFGHRQVDGARYSIFKLTAGKGKLPKKIGQLNEADLKSYLQIFSKANVTVLELAATANWLAEKEKRDDWQEALRRRKGPKVDGGRLERALALLRDIGLPPAMVDAKA